MKRQLFSFLITASGVIEAQAPARHQIQASLHETCRAGLCIPAGAPECLRAHWPLRAPDCRDGFTVIGAGRDAAAGALVGPKAN